MNSHYDVAVLGGGFAGITAAREASQRGCSVVLLEASHRLGGRTWTDDRLGTRIEMGGTDVHWLQPHVWAELTRYRLPVEEFAPPQHLIYLDDGVARTGNEDFVFGLMDKGMTALADVARAAYERPHEPRFVDEALNLDKLTVGEFFDGVEMTKLERDMTSSFWAAASQAPLHEAGLTMALRWLALGGWDWRVMLDVISRYKIVGGTGRLVDGIAGDMTADVQYGSTVVKVDETADNVVITMADGRSVTAQAAVCALPINVLTDVEFTPTRAHLRNIAEDGHISRGQKIICRVKGHREPYMAFAPEGHPLVWLQYDRPIDGDHIAVAFGPDATQVDSSSVESVQNVLRTWIPDIEVAEVASHNWTGDPLFRGTWAVPAPGKLLRQLEAIEYRDGRVLLAGADVARGSYALIDGAIDTGISAGRAASEICGRIASHTVQPGVSPYVLR
jgi:monoamine oxidase